MKINSYRLFILIIILASYSFTITSCGNNDEDSEVIRSVFSPEEAQDPVMAGFSNPPDDCREIMSSDISNSECLGEELLNICNTWICQEIDDEFEGNPQELIEFIVLYFACDMISCNSLQCDEYTITIENNNISIEIIAEDGTNQPMKLECFALVV